MFRHKKKSDRKEFDREKMIPAVRSSICTGEKVAGFRNKQTGKFEEVMMIRTEQELQEFADMYGFERAEIQVFY
ncbi:MAG TPA: aspartate dehydrogenase [Candidatus Eubacterium avistercoris]|uniref:Aspartate dehydrogenase n=1 Tax=Candidatus Eubacterium avistercoris TaxID=2838567 RepID=A0A9D2D532_9FIRM|nr:aspartate dehydrogenase [Candidatus Eubacterium avistercoris]